MSVRCLAILATFSACVAIIASGTAAAADPAAPGHWKAPRTEHGQPDLQGFWTNATITATQERLHEYACHEGNYALPGILTGAREQEKTAAVE